MRGASMNHKMAIWLLFFGYSIAFHHICFQDTHLTTSSSIEKLTPTSSTPDAIQQDYLFDLIDSMFEDVTGDQIEDEITLYGRLLTENSDYYDLLWVEVRSENDATWTIPIKTGGYEPTLNLIDVTQNGIPELIVSLLSNTDIQEHYYFIFENNTFKSMDKPKLEYMDAQLTDHYAAHIYLTPFHEAYEISLESIEHQLIKDNIYDSNGHLLLEQKLYIQDPHQYEPVFIGPDHGYGLKSEQYIHGIYNHALIGTINILWYYENDRWINIQHHISKIDQHP